MRTSERRLLEEALRRYVMFHNGEPLTEAWTGLGYKTTYRPAVEAGLMEWIHGEEPPDRAPQWLRLTGAGAEIVQRWLDEEEN